MRRTSPKLLASPASRISLSLAALSVGVLGGVLLLAASPMAAQAQDHAEIIANALSAAPESARDDASVMLGDGTVLKEGSGPLTCMPDDPNVPNNAPMCLDGPWLAWVGAWMNKTEPAFEGLGVGYMLQGDFPASNTDPYAEGPTDDNQWMPHGVPHVMIVVPDASLLDDISTDPENGGPWVMWKGTPYAHLMIPAPQSR